LPEGALRITGRLEGMEKLALSPDGRLTAVCGQDSTVKLYDTATLTIQKEIDTHGGECNGVDFTYDSKQLVTGGSDQIASLWDVESGRNVRKFEGHEGEVRAVAASPDGLLLASSDTAGAIHIWDMQTGARLHKLTGHELRFADGTVSPVPRRIDGLAFSPDSRLALSEADDESARVWDAVAGKHVRTMHEHDGSVAAVAISPNGAYCVSTRGIQMSPYGAAMRLWEIATGRVRRVFLGHEADITCLAFSPDGRHILSGSNDRTLRQWDVESGIEVRRFQLASVPSSLACSADGSFALSLSDAEGLALWDLNSAPLTGVAGGRATAINNVGDAWENLQATEYIQRALACHFFMEKLTPAQAVEELAKRLEAGKNPDANTTRRELVEALDDERYSQRMSAFEKLNTLAGAARTDLVAGLDHASLEVRARCAELLQKIGGGVDIRAMLACEILFLLKTPEAREQLQKIAASGRGEDTRHARALLAHWGK
jgi:dipeptidyl aminopeptidase/acylaminoacyl peptidase